MTTGPTLPELLQEFATAYGPTLRDEDIAATAAEAIRIYFAVMPRHIERSDSCPTTIEI